MIRNISLTNFKSWEQLDLSLAPITVLFGANSSGKSSLIQFLLLLKQTQESVDRSIDMNFGSESSFVNLGSFKNIVHNHSLDNVIKWTIIWSLRKELRISDPEKGRTSVLFSGTELQIESALADQHGSARSTELKYFFNDSSFSLRPKHHDRPTDFDLSFQSTAHSSFKFKRQPGRAWALPGPVKSYAFPDQAKTYYQNSGFLSDFEREYEDLMNRIYYLGPLRDYPKRQYTWTGTQPRDVGLRGENVIDAILAANRGEKQNLAFKGRRKRFIDIISYWLKYLGLANEFSVNEVAHDSNIYITKVLMGSSSVETSIVDMGFGVSQVLPVIVLLYYVPKDSIVLLEQPEIHLHPSVQSKLADIIIHASLYRGIQVILESHSEHLLRRLQRRIAEGRGIEKVRVSNSDVALYFCEYIHNKSSIRRIEVNQYGEILNWPNGFFGDEFHEIAAIKLAGLNKKQANEGDGN